MCELSYISMREGGSSSSNALVSSSSNLRCDAVSASLRAMASSAFLTAMVIILRLSPRSGLEISILLPDCFDKADSSNSTS